uniref:Guanylate kinase n=1 Tax=Candidatus Kentrum sp. LPFa TaxID=2126335 RepID=A0A450WIZ0_9GAMM|nr:MAG: guanylate kinase [Candidatus Kentron sp. LPFa]VFK32165.1 MAG: guanylate kinase [Candidatus Kentron sp. LPFa]
MENPGILYIISAPSGAGKTSLVQALAAADPKVAISVSYTTRPPRPREEHGVHYHFVSEQAFRDMRAHDAFLEYAEVFGNHYGTSGEWIGERLGEGLDIILEIDWQGARQAREKVPDCVSIFILPPSRDALRERLRDRRQDDDAVIAKRMREAKAESIHFDEFDYLIVNDDFHRALSDLQAILWAGRLRRFRQAKNHQPLIASLLSD